MLPSLRAFAARHRRFLSFCAVGASGVIVNLLIFWAVLYGLEGGKSESETGSGSWWINNTALLAGWVVSVASNFALNDRLTFRDAASGYRTSWPRRLASYYTSALVAFAIQWGCFNGLVWAIDSSLGEPIRVYAASAGALPWLVNVTLQFRRTFANLAGIGIATIANYLLAKHWVFRASSDDVSDVASSPSPAAATVDVATEEPLEAGEEAT